MSSLPKTPQDIKDLIAERERYLSAERKAIDKREALSEPEEIPQLMATLALARSAGADIGTPASPMVPVRITSAGMDIGRDGCDLIGATQAFLDHLDCPGGARELVLTLMGLSGGNCTDVLDITDAKLAERCGLNPKTIQRQRQALIDWQRARDYYAVAIIQREYNRETSHYGTMQYRILLTPIVVDFIKRARANAYLQRAELKNPSIPVEQVAKSGARKVERELALESAKKMEKVPLQERPRWTKNVTPRPFLDSRSARFARLDRILDEIYVADIRSGYAVTQTFTAVADRNEEAVNRNAQGSRNEQNL